MKIEIPQVVYQTKTITKFNSDGMQALLHVEYSSPYIDCDGYDKLSEAVQKWGNTQNAVLLDYIDNVLMEEILQKADEGFFEDYPEKYYGQVNRIVRSYRIDSRIVSLRSTTSIQLYGSSEVSIYEGVIFDAATGEILELQDIITDIESFMIKAKKYIEKEITLSVTDKILPNYEETIFGIWDSKPQYYLDAEGISFIFNPDEKNHFKDAAFVTLPYESFRKCFSDDYIKMNGQFVVQATVNSGDVYMISLTRGCKYMLVSEKKNSSSSNVILFFKCTHGEIILCSSLRGADLQIDSINTNKLTVNVKVNVFGSYHATMNYRISEDGELIQVDDVFKIVGNDYFLTVKNDLPVTINGTKTELLVGSQICITGTDDISVAYFQIKNTSTEGSITFRRPLVDPDQKDLLFINSLPDFLFFENLSYKER